MSRSEIGAIILLAMLVGALWLQVWWSRRERSEMRQRVFTPSPPKKPSGETHSDFPGWVYVARAYNPYDRHDLCLAHVYFDGQEICSINRKRDLECDGKWGQKTQIEWIFADAEIEAVASRFIAARDEKKRQEADALALELDAQRRQNEMAANAELERKRKIVRSKLFGAIKGESK